MCYLSVFTELEAFILSILQLAFSSNIATFCPGFVLKHLQSKDKGIIFALTVLLLITCYFLLEALVE